MAETVTLSIFSFADLGVGSARSRKARRPISSSPPASWMDEVEGPGDLRDGTRHRSGQYAGADRASPGRRSRDDRCVDLDLAGMLGDERLAMLVDSRPAGVYGASRLTALGLWDSVEPLVAQADNARGGWPLSRRTRRPMARLCHRRCGAGRC